ncbi:MAG: hypothetical protein P1P88_00005, partial [Bacteroidales bacterium]|nr:hypothetical protein [Bacteroidales bacterium]
MSKREIKKPQKTIKKTNKRVVQKTVVKNSTKDTFKLSGFGKLISKHSFLLSLSIIFGILIFVFKDFV